MRPSAPGGVPFPAGESPSVLVLKPLALGDVLRTTPLLEALRRARPSARVTFAVADYAARALANNPHIDEVLSMGELGTPRRYDASSYLRFARMLRARRFDAALVLDRSPLMALLPYLARIPLRIGLDSRGRGFAHTTRVPIEPDDHEVSAYLRVGEAAGINAVDVGCHFFPTPQDTEATVRLIEEFGLAEVRPRVIVGPGGGVNPGAVDVSKRWPVERFARVADALVARSGAAIVLVGQPSDASSVASVRDAMRFDAVDLSGQTSFGQLAALIQGGDLFIGNDSAAAQLAACVGTPSVTIFTTTEPWIYGPYAANARWVYEGDPESGLRGIPSIDAVTRAADAAIRAAETRSDRTSDGGGVPNGSEHRDA